MNETGNPSEYHKKSGFSSKTGSESLAEMNMSSPNILGYTQNFMNPNLYNNLCTMKFLSRSSDSFEKPASPNEETNELNELHSLHE